MSISQTTKDIVGRALSIDANDVSAATELGVSPEWDSLAHMRLIFAIEDHLKEKLGPDAIVQLTSAREVEALINA